MSGEIEAAGAAVTAGLVAGAIEGGKGGDHAQAHGACSNCGAELNGAYCSVGSTGRRNTFAKSLGWGLEV